MITSRFRLAASAGLIGVAVGATAVELFRRKENGFVSRVNAAEVLPQQIEAQDITRRPMYVY